jgi:hypothetical protein
MASQQHKEAIPPQLLHAAVVTDPTLKPSLLIEMNT